MDRTRTQGILFSVHVPAELTKAAHARRSRKRPLPNRVEIMLVVFKGTTSLVQGWQVFDVEYSEGLDMCTHNPA